MPLLANNVERIRRNGFTLMSTIVIKTLPPSKFAFFLEVTLDESGPREAKHN